MTYRKSYNPKTSELEINGNQKILLDERIKRAIYEDYVKGYYEEDINEHIESNNLKINNSQKESILDKYFENRQDASFSWQECLENAFIAILGWTYKEDYKNE